VQFYVQKNKGLAMDHYLAEELNMLDEFLLWEEEKNTLPFFEKFENTFGVEPDMIQAFDDYVQGLQGFECDLTYVLFDSDTDSLYPEQWSGLLAQLEEHDVDIIEGSWAETD